MSKSDVKELAEKLTSSGISDDQLDALKLLQDHYKKYLFVNNDFNDIQIRHLEFARGYLGRANVDKGIHITLDVQGSNEHFYLGPKLAHLFKKIIDDLNDGKELVLISRNPDDE